MPSKDYYFGIAKAARMASKDRSRKVGAVLVDPEGGVCATGYNGFPRGVNDDYDERHERPTKYDFVEHSERNVIYQAARKGIATQGCTLYTWAEGSDIGVCTNCARAIIQAGIVKVVLQRPDNQAGSNPNQVPWAVGDLNVAKLMLSEAGVVVEFE